MSSLEIQHQTRAVFHCWGDKGLLEGIGGLPRVCGGSQQSHIYLLSIAFVNMDPPVHLTSLLCQAYLGESMLFVPYFYHGPRGDRSFKVWFGADSKNQCESDQPMRAQSRSTPIAVRVHPCLDYTLMDYTLMDYLWMDYKDSWTTPNWTTYDVWTTAVWTTNHLDYPPIGLPMTFGLPPFGLHPK